MAQEKDGTLRYIHQYELFPCSDDHGALIVSSDEENYLSEQASLDSCGDNPAPFQDKYFDHNSVSAYGEKFYISAHRRDCYGPLEARLAEKFLAEHPELQLPSLK